ncbi:MAG: hypothetical protein KC636_17805 [Myxococcales bacterium]|nr:hypothetical protein [Myxococcales bacterium]
MPAIDRPFTPPLLLFTAALACSACGPERVDSGPTAATMTDGSASTAPATDDATVTTEGSSEASTDASTDATSEATTEEVELPCGPLELPAYDPDFTLSWCFDDAWSDAPILIDSEQAWLARVESCPALLIDALPTIDWSTTELVGHATSVPCPWRGGYTLTRRDYCDGVLDLGVTASSDYCFCDYEAAFVHLFAVPAGSVETVTLMKTLSPSCEEVTCDCDGAPVSGCVGCPSPYGA